MKFFIYYLISILLLISCAVDKKKNDVKCEENLENIPILVSNYIRSASNILFRAKFISINTNDLTLIDSSAISDFAGWSNTIGLCTENKDYCYFLSSYKNQVLKLSNTNGNVEKRIVVKDFPGQISNQISKEGVFLINHSVMEEQGFRISIIDEKNDVLIVDSIFLPENVWNYTIYDSITDSYFISLSTKDENDQPYDKVYKLRLDNFKLTCIHSTKLIQTISALAINDNKLYIGINNLLARDPDTDEWINNNKPLCLTYDVVTSGISTYSIRRNMDNHYIKTFFKHDENIYMLFGESVIPKPGVNWNQWIYRWNKRRKKFVKYRKQPIDNLYFNASPIICDGHIIFTNVEMNEIQIRKINIEKPGKKEYKVQIVV